MKGITLKKLNELDKLKNKTKKHRIKETIVDNLTKQQKEIVCKKSPNTYTTFEDKIEESFKKHNINFLSTNQNLQKQMLHDLKQAVSPSKITPQNDFYSYINERWLKNYKVETGQEYIVEVDDFRIVQDKVYRELLEIVKNFIKQPNVVNKKKQNCIKNAYESFSTFNTQEQSRNDINRILKLIDEFREDKENLWKLLAEINKNEIVSAACPFVWTLNPDEKNPKVYKCYLESPQVTLIDYNIYYDDGSEIEYKKKYRNIYFKFLNELFENAFGKNHVFNVKDVFDCEKKMIDAMSCNIIKEVDADDYNLVTKDESIKYFNFDWEKFATALGFKKIPNEFITSNINYLLCGTKLLLQEWDSQAWRTYWIYIFLKQQQRFNVKGHKIIYEFQGNYVRGQQKEISIELRAVFGLGFTFNTFLTNEYILRYKNDSAINYVNTMARDLKTVFIRIIKRNKWLQPKTKEKALLKLKHFKLIVGSPKILREDPLLDYKKDDSWGNLLKMCAWRHNEALQLNDKPIIDIPVMDWNSVPPKFVGTQAYVVNASYTPTQNAIYIPLGYIQKPFVDLDERGIEYNLSRIGFTIAHEMSHALDDWGSKYNQFGVLSNWWTKKDKKIFKSIQRNVVDEYEKFASYDGIKFDAWPSIGEDLADISGITICLEYLRDFQLKNSDILPIQTVSFQTFFIYFAIQQRQQINKKAILAQLKTNPHPLDKYRCNVPLSRLPVFRIIYKVKKGDKMWWPSTNRVWE